MLRRPTSETNPADWFALGEERLQGCDLLWKHQGLTALGIEALQEGVERYLKGYLVARGWRLEKVHDLHRLVTQAATYNPQFSQFEDLADELTADFFAQHYPGGDMTEVGNNYATLRLQAGELVALIKLGLPQFFSSEDAGSESQK